MNERHIPPQSIESEMSVLGAVFLDGRAIDDVQETIEAEDFYRQPHRLIFQTMIDLSEGNKPIDLVTMTSAMQSAGTLEEAGGASYLVTLIDYVPTAANVRHYCRIVKDKSHKRALLIRTQEVQGMIYEDKPLDEVQDHLEKGIVTEKTGNEPAPAKIVLREVTKNIEERYERRGQIQGIPYGIPELDELTNGMHRGDLIIVAGRPSMGKSAFAGNIAESVCGNSGMSALIFTLEMSRSDYMDRILSSHGHIKYHHILSGQLMDTEWARSANSMRTISEWGLHIDDTPAITFPSIRSKARKLKKTGLDLVVVDYLQLMLLPKKDNRVQAIGDVTRNLKQLARELDLPVVALSQLSRGVDSRPDKRPMMSDLRDSGEVEQDADVILFPFRPAAYCKDCKDKVDDGAHSYIDHQYKAEIIIEKQRKGPRNESVPVAWAGEYQKFRGLRQ